MKTLAVLVIGILLAASPSAFAAKVPLRMIASVPGKIAEPNKRDVIARLKTLQEKQASEVAALDLSIQKLLDASKEIDGDDDNLIHVAQRTDRMAKQIDQYTRERNEKNARREVLDRIIFSVDSKWAPGVPLKTYLEKSFLEMASKDLTDGRDARLWKAFTYLSICVREVPEPREDILDVIEGYLNFSGVLNPRTPAEFLASRSYTNGAESVAAQPVPRERVGDTPATRTAILPTAGRAPVMEMRSTLPDQSTIEAPEAAEPIDVDETVSATTTGMSPMSKPAGTTPFTQQITQ